MGKKRITQVAPRALSAATAARFAAERKVVEGGHPALRELARTLRTDKELAVADAKKRRTRAKNKAARAAKRKARA